MPDCPFCAEPMTHWNQGIYECEDCETMIPIDCLEDEEDDHF